MKRPGPYPGTELYCCLAVYQPQPRSTETVREQLDRLNLRMAKELNLPRAWKVTQEILDFGQPDTFALRADDSPWMQISCEIARGAMLKAGALHAAAAIFQAPVLFYLDSDGDILSLGYCEPEHEPQYAHHANCLEVLMDFGEQEMRYPAFLEQYMEESGRAAARIAWRRDDYVFQSECFNALTACMTRAPWPKWPRWDTTALSPETEVLAMPYREEYYFDIDQPNKETES